MKHKSDVNPDRRGAYDAPNQKIEEAGSAQDSIEGDSRQISFDGNVLSQHFNQYSRAQPYKHFVIPQLMDDTFLRNVRTEILQNVQFTLKEADSYRIHESANLASLDGLHDEELSKLPTLLRLRDALYSPAFRNYISTVTGCGALSGGKTDMAINLYTPGCYLLCHDDVFGSRKVSYVLHLTDPDIPWQKEWGGALRLYPIIRSVEGENYHTAPSPYFSKVIPPSWNQLSFFAASPGENFHDVEEVYHANNKGQLEKKGGRICIAISGWFHIPQFGEYNYIESDEKSLWELSILARLHRNGARLTFPPLLRTATKFSFKVTKFEGTDIDFLLKYLAPTYLTPGTMQQVVDHFAEQSSVTLDCILSEKFSTKLREHLEKQELPEFSAISRELGTVGWRVARSPHKHRFLYLPDSSSLRYLPQVEDASLTPVQELLQVLLPSHPFRKWLELATNCGINRYSIMARRFRRGQDYMMATVHEGEPRLEVSICMTPTSGWGDDESDGSENEEGSEGTNDSLPDKRNGKSKAKGKAKAVEKEEKEKRDVGGQETYMTHDKKADDDAAVYGINKDVEYNTILCKIPATWNKMSIVLRGSGVVKFVRYVSKSAKGDRWDISGEYGLGAERSDKREFNGFLDSEDGDSDMDMLRG